MKKSSSWCVYILKCGGGRLYTGMTNDLEQRVRAHRAGRGCRFTRAFGVKALVYTEECSDRSGALRREAVIKRLPREKKLSLVKGKHR